MVNWLLSANVCRCVTEGLGRKKRIALAASAVVFIGLLPSGASGQSTLITNYGTYTEGSLPALPAAGGTLVDSTFGTTIMRLTDANDGTDCRVEYSYWPSFNVDSTKVMALCVNSIDRTKIWMFDPVNFKRGTAIMMPATLQSYDAIWSGTSNHTIYGHSTSNVLLSFDTNTQTTTTIKDFSGVVPSGGRINQMSVSQDDDTFAFHVTNSSGSAVGYFVWRRGTNTYLLNRSETGIDEVQVDKSGHYLEVGYTNGNNRIWDLQAQTYTSLTWGTNGFFHHDSGHGTILTANAAGNGWAYRSLLTPSVFTNLLNLQSAANRTPHFSMRADNEGWGLISEYNGDGSSVHQPFDNEIYQVATDGSGNVRRIAHHRSVYNDYYDAPFANISRDGKFVAFSSNWGNANGRRDVFIVKIPPAPGTASSSTASPTCPAPSAGAFTGCYYSDTTLTNLALARTDSYPLAFNWGYSGPDPSVPADYFSADWRGEFSFNAGTYVFTVTVDDGARLYVDGQLVLDKWISEAATKYTVTRTMTAGTHLIRLAYYEAHNTATANLSWAPSSTSGSSSTATWTSTDVGSVSPAGSASVNSSGVATESGSGADIWNSSDAFHFYYRPLSGDGEIVARVASVQNVNQWTKAAVMMRNTTSSGSAHAMMLVSPGKGTAFQRRVSAGGLSTSTAGPLVKAPYWVRLVRSGSTFSAYASADGTTWTIVGSQTIAMGTTIDVGLAVTSHDSGTLATATFDHVTVTQH